MNPFTNREKSDIIGSITEQGGRGRMRFTKMQGIGNDYVYVNCFEEHVENPSELARQMSRRHYGVGSDGLILGFSAETIPAFPYRRVPSGLFRP